MPHLVETASDRLRQDSGRGPLRCAETAETSPAIRLGLTSIMFHYRDPSPVVCNWLGAATGFSLKIF